MSELRINWKNLLLVVPLKNGSFLNRDYLYKYGDINDIYKKSFFGQNIYIKKFFIIIVIIMILIQQNYITLLI